MRILLTGASGQVGGALLPLLRARGDDVLTPRRDQFNLADPAALRAWLEAWRPELIVNPAAYTAVDRAEDETALAYRVNAESPAVIAGWAASHQVPLLHFSTDYVYDGSGEAPWREDSPVGPLSAYGASKLAGDQAIAAAGGPHLILRTCWVYAATGSNFLRTIVRLARERPELRIVADQIGAPTSARAIAAAAASLLPDTAAELAARLARDGGVVHVACAGATSWHGFAEAIVTGLRARGATLAVERIVPIGTADFPTKAKRPGNSRLDLSRLNGVFGIPTPSWQEALEVELDALVREVG